MADVSGAFPGIKQFRHEGCLSYIFFDRVSKAAAVIDPRVDLMDDYREFIAENGLKPVVALDTHIHADHYSGTHFFAKEYKAVIGMSAKTTSKRAGKRLAKGDRIAVGERSLTVLETPGHTADSISFLGGGMVFTGDTLFISSSGRTDFPTADPEAQWRSIHEVLGALPDETLVFPGHDYDDLISSTIGIEKTKNPHWLIPTLEKFVAMKKAELIPTAIDEIRKRVDFNAIENPPGDSVPSGGAATACGTCRADTGGVASINVEKLAPKLEEKSGKSAFIDVREKSEFREGHVPGTENVPLSEIGLHFARLMKFQRVYVTCLSGGRSQSAAKTLSYWGIPDAVNVTGGYRAWVKAGFPVEKIVLD